MVFQLGHAGLQAKAATIGRAPLGPSSDEPMTEAAIREVIESFALAVEYAKRLAELGIHGLEVSCGTSLLSPWNLCRGDVPVKELLPIFPEAKRPPGLRIPV